MSLIIIVHLISCQNHDPINLNGHWTIIAIHGIEKEAINDGDFYTTGMRVDFESNSKKLFVKLNHYDWSTAQYEVRPDENLLIITQCDPWLIGDYYFEKESSMMSPNVTEDRLYLTEESKGKRFTLLKITNSGF